MVDNFETIYKKLVNNIKKGIAKANLVLMKELKELTPEDTKEMLNSYKILETKEEAGVVEGGVGNTAKYSLYVEYGIAGRTYDYHKPAGPEPRPVIYSGVGNRTFARALDNKKTAILSEIKKSLND